MAHSDCLWPSRELLSMSIDSKLDHPSCNEKAKQQGWSRRSMSTQLANEKVDDYLDGLASLKGTHPIYELKSKGNIKGWP